MKRDEYDNFSDLLAKVVKVPHSEIKAKLDAEKKAKKLQKNKTPRRSTKRV